MRERSGEPGQHHEDATSLSLLVGQPSLDFGHIQVNG